MEVRLLLRTTPRTTKASTPDTCNACSAMHNTTDTLPSAWSAMQNTIVTIRATCGLLCIKQSTRYVQRIVRCVSHNWHETCDAWSAMNHTIDTISATHVRCVSHNGHDTCDAWSSMNHTMDTICATRVRCVSHNGHDTCNARSAMHHTIYTLRTTMVRFVYHTVNMCSTMCPKIGITCVMRVLLCLA